MAENQLTAEMERNVVSIGNPVYLNVTFSGAQDVDCPEVRKVDGLQIKYVGPSTQVTIINGRVSQSITHAFLVIPLREGNFEIGPFKTSYKGEVFVSPPVRLRVTGGAGNTGAGVGNTGSTAGPQYPQQAPGNPPGQGFQPYAGDKLFILVDVPRTRIYLNEEVPLTIKLYVDNMNLKEIEFPIINLDGFSAGEWLEPQRRQEMFKGMDYGTLVFQRTLFGIKEGNYRIGPATLKCKMINKKFNQRRPAYFRSGPFDDGDVFGNIFGQVEIYPIELSSNSIDVTVSPFPEEGKPAGFKGAVGDFRMETTIEPRKVKVGDPVTLRTAVSGFGNLDTVNSPMVNGNTDKFKTYDPQTSVKDKQKIFEQIFIPKTDEAKEIPAVTFSYFNPQIGQYVTLKQGPFPLSVEKQTETEKAVKIVSGGGTEETLYPPEKLGQDIIHIKDAVGHVQRKGALLYKDPLFWWAHLVPVLVFFGLYGFMMRRERLKTDERYARFLSAPRSAKSGVSKARSFLSKGDISRFYDVLYKTMQVYIGNKLGIPKGSVTPGHIERKLKEAGGDEEVTKMVHRVFSGCDMARYASTLPDKEAAKEDLSRAEDIIHYLEKTKI
jgi:hypothetical protein